MRSVLVGLAALVLCVAPMGAWRKSPKPPELEVLSSTARRTEGSITLDGRVRNSGEKPIEGLVLMFEFFAPGRVPLTQQKSAIDQEVLEPRQESAFHFELDDPVRAVRYTIGAVDAGERQLRVANTGPFVIE